MVWFAALMGIYEAWWRRCFGSDGWGIAFLRLRAVQHILNFLVLTVALICSGTNWVVASIAMILLQAFFWAPGHGPAFDLGRAPVDDEMKARYDKEMRTKLLYEIFPEETWYTKVFDFFWMLLRYGVPGLVVGTVLNNPYIFMAGLAVPFIYEACYSTKQQTELAELLVGFAVGYSLFL